MVVGKVEGQVGWETMDIGIEGGGGGRWVCGSLCTQRPRLRRWRSAAAGAGSRGGGGGERGGGEGSEEAGRSWSEEAGRGEIWEELTRRGVYGEELLGREAGARGGGRRER